MIGATSLCHVVTCGAGGGVHAQSEIDASTTRARVMARRVGEAVKDFKTERSLLFRAPECFLKVGALRFKVVRSFCVFAGLACPSFIPHSSRPVAHFLHRRSRVATPSQVFGRAGALRVGGCL